MKTGYLQKEDVLLCRRVSKPMKEAVDEELLKQNPEWLTNKTLFVFTEEVEEFLLCAREFIKDGNVSTLLSRSVKVIVNSALPFSVALNLLQEHGKWIRSLKFNFFLIDDRLDSSFWMEMLIACLNLVPALEYLGLVYDRDEDDDDDEVFEEIDWMVAFEWNNLVPPPVSHFPPLKSLTELVVRLEMEGIALDPPTNFCNPIFTAYGSQVSKLLYQPSLLYQVEDLMVLNLYFSDLRELELFGTPHVDMWENIGQLNLHQLTKLKISGSDMEVMEIVPVLKQLSDNLEELYLGIFTSDEVENPRVWRNVVFSKLKRLTLCAEDIRAFWRNWYLLQIASFPALEELTVKSLSPLDLEQDEVALIPKLGEPDFDRLSMLKVISFKIV